MMQDQKKNQKLDDCLAQLIILTEQAIEAIRGKDVETLSDLISQRQSLVDQLQMISPDPKQLSASALAQRARLYELSSHMTREASLLKEEQRQGLVSVRQEKMISRYQQKNLEPIQALDIRE